MHFLTPDDVATLAATVTPRFATLVYAAAYTGMRAGELAALGVTALNLLAGTVDVTESRMEVGGQLIAGPTKTGRPRTLTLPRFLAEILGEHVGRYPTPEGFVFTMTEGGPIRQRNFYRRHFKPAVLDAGLPAGLHFHSLRHTCAAFLIADGRHMEDVADSLDETFRRAAARPAATEMRPTAPVIPFRNASQGPKKGP
jgi:integrase